MNSWIDVRVCSYRMNDVYLQCIDERNVNKRNTKSNGMHTVDSFTLSLFSWLVFLPTLTTSVAVCFAFETIKVKPVNRFEHILFFYTCSDGFIVMCVEHATVGMFICFNWTTIVTNTTDQFFFYFFYSSNFY